MAVLSPVIVPIAVVGVSCWWIEDNSRKLKRRWLGPYVDRWQRWFAWRPVVLDNGWGATVWLETVERKALGSSYHWGVVYQSVAKNPTETTT
jgi:hypothetical protein